MLKKPIVLVAQKDYCDYLLVKGALVKWGFPGIVFRFCDGRALIDFLLAADTGNCLEEGAFLLMVEVNLPVVGGVEVLREVKQNKRLKHIPVMLLAGREDGQMAETCIDLGCCGFFKKPLGRDDFFDTLEKIGMHIPNTPT